MWLLDTSYAVQIKQKSQITCHICQEYDLFHAKIPLMRQRSLMHPPSLTRPGTTSPLPNLSMMTHFKIAFSRSLTLTFKQNTQGFNEIPPEDKQDRLVSYF